MRLLDQPTPFLAKIRYKDEGALANCWVDRDGYLHVVFDKPRRAITPGQSVVLYEGTTSSVAALSPPAPDKSRMLLLQLVTFIREK